MNQAGSYTLTASSSPLTGATSSALNITPSAASKLIFSTQPGGTVAGSNLAPQPIVWVEDANGNTITNSSAMVTLAVGTGPGALSGVAVATASSGIATFSGLFLKQAGSYTLTATSSALTAATSSALNITSGTASKLIFSTQPGGTSAGSNLAPQPIVWIEDANGNVATNSSAMVTLAVGTGPGALSGVAVATASSGIATFSGLFLNQSGSYTLTATSSPLTAATSSALNITPGTASKLIFSTQPGGTVAGSNLAPQPIVWVEDANGNIATNSSAMVTLAVGTGPGALSGVAVATASSGIATFSGLFLNQAGSYTLTATSSPLTAATSSALNITSGTASKLIFFIQPGGTSAGSNLSPQPIVWVEDANGNIATNSSAMVTLAVGTGPGTLSGVAVATASSGIATFSGLFLNQAGSYTLTATSSPLTGATSSALNITPGTAQN